MCGAHYLLLEVNHGKLSEPGGTKPFNIALVPYSVELCHDYLGQDKHEGILFQEAV